MSRVGRFVGITAALAALGLVVPAVRAEEPPPALDPAASEQEQKLLKLFDDDEFLTARRETETYLEDHPDSVVGHYVLGRVLHAAEGSLPQAMRELGLARELFEKAHPPGTDAPNWRLHQQILYSTAWLALELEEYEFQLEILDFHDALYNPMAAGEHAWPLMRLGRFERARDYAAHAIASKQPYQRALGYNAMCALEGEAEEREPYYRACLEALVRKREQSKKPGETSTLVIDAYNAAEAALAAFKPDEAEKLALEGTRNFLPSSANPWRLLVAMRLSQGRAGEAIDALREMGRWRRRQPANVRAQDRAETDAVAATVFFLAGETERGLALADGLIEAPDRRGLTTTTAEQSVGGHALLRRALRRTQSELDAERRSWGEPRVQGFWARARDRIERFAAERADEERVVRVLTERSLLSATLRPYLAHGLDDVPPWLVGDLVGIVGAGVFRSALDEARAMETSPAAVPYFDAYEAEASLAAGDERRAEALARKALDGLPPSEALLRARTAAVAFRALGSETEGALAFLEQALALDGGVFRRLGWRIPVRLELPSGAVGDSLRRLLEDSPRFDVGDTGVVVRVESKGGEDVICVHGPTSGAALQCGRPRQLAESGSDPSVAPSAEALAQRFAVALHLEAFAPPLGLTGNDVSSLDGSTTTSGQAVRELLQNVLDAESEPKP